MTASATSTTAAGEVECVGRRALAGCALVSVRVGWTKSEMGVRGRGGSTGDPTGGGHLDGTDFAMIGGRPVRHGIRPRPIPADSRRERQLPSATTSAARRYEMARKTKVSYTNVEMLGKAEYLLLYSKGYGGEPKSAEEIARTRRKNKKDVVAIPIVYDTPASYIPREKVNQYGPAQSTFGNDFDLGRYGQEPIICKRLVAGVKE
ncbi:hypothetical protein FIBSPDRAFT_904287 [Athelia psychrophila]|uniref:Uncharacterized protein n=1 Tax=Athelia psychrophila TaxID=1759441 RepID=A0A167UY16_9AGAM|nr:hypothetical protein FIBSPDRAFT_904287 [Fibularhizoctonia sp. CBS 109695]